MPERPTFSLTTLGALDLTSVERGSVQTLLAQPKRLALLLYLLIEHPGSFARRDSLLALFWPDADESRARASLRQALQFLRRTLGDDAVRSRGDDEVGIDRDRFACDVLTFREARAAGRDADALAAYAGPFLPGFLVDELPEFEAWVSTRRQALQDEAARTAGALADAAEKTGGDRSVALGHAERAVALAPLDERAAQRLARLLDAAGDRGAALLVFDALRSRLAQELGVAPSPETAALERQVRERAAARGAPLASPSPSPSLATSIPVIEPPRMPDAAVASGSPSTPAGPSASRRQVRTSPALIVAVLLVVAVVGGLLARRGTDRPRDAARGAAPEAAPLAPRVLVTPFDNQTGDLQLAALGSMAADWITEGLSRVDGITVVPLSAVASSSRALGRDSLAPLDTAYARLARDLGATVLVRGTAYRTGATLHLQAQVADVRTGALVRPAESVSVPVDSVMQGIDRLRTRLVAGFAVLGDTVTHLRRAVAPPSYAAYRDYVQGLETFVQGDAREALTRFERSARADPAFPMPRIAAAIMLMNLGEADSAARMAASVEKARDDLGPLERATFDMVRGMLAADLEAVDRAVREQARIAPGTIGHYMVAEVARRRGRPREAIAVLQGLGPDKGELRGWMAFWRELTAAHHMRGDHEAELAAARAAVERHPDAPVMRGYLVRALAALGDTAGMVRVIADRAALASTSAPDEGSLLFTAANGLAARGDTLLAQAWREREVTWYARAQGTSRRPSLRLRAVRALVLLDRLDAAHDSLRVLIARDSNDVTVLGLAGITAVRRGDAAGAARIVARLDAIDRVRTAPVRALAERDVLYWHAAMAAQRGDADSAVRILREAYAAGRARDPELASDPWFARIRSASAFRALVEYAD